MSAGMTNKRQLKHYNCAANFALVDQSKFLRFVESGNQNSNKKAKDNGKWGLKTLS